MDKLLYTIGIDYGSLSCRGVLAATDGTIAAEAEFSYPHGIIDRALPDGTTLTGSWCLEHPADFVQALETVVPELLRKSGADPDRIVGIGVDFTASTVIPVDAFLTPLCLNPAFSSRPHAWCKLWKHHGAARQAERITRVCQSRGIDLDLYGGHVNSECLLAKVIQVFDEDPEVYDAADAFIEAGDYITSLLAGRPVISASFAAAKALWSKSGYPDRSFYAALHPGLSDLPGRKLADHLGTVPLYPGTKAAVLCPEMARRLGLKPGITISPAQLDGYAPMAALGISAPETAMLVIGTSTATMLLSRERRPVQGVTACLKDTYYPGLWGYASGQTSVGDCFQWFVDNCLPEDLAREARDRHMSPHALLTEKAAPLEPGETGLVALDWFNGCKSPLSDSSLTGVILGLTLRTRPEHIFRALLEATAFGARYIQDAYRDAGVRISSVAACGGIAGKNPLMMQIYADVLDMPLRVSGCRQAPALGSAIYAAAAAGEQTGFADIFAAVEAMHCRDCTVYMPRPEANASYEKLYAKYRAMASCFGETERL